ncbi:MAG: hypothetical protein ABSD47_07280 [Candidatus Methylomirabilota bacterium]|jgi:beta-lactamase superfamily II metal-dependent hydrolase
MEIRIFDVAHGFCAFVAADNRNTMLIDCGHNDETSFYPAEYLLGRRCSGIESFFSLNYDEDHLSGLPRLREVADRIPIQVFYRNKSVTSDRIRTLKWGQGPLGPGIRALLQMAETYTAAVTSPPEYQNLEFALFHNNYPDFTDTNNLSLVLFLHYPNFSIVFPGDLEGAGWRRLLQQASFRQHLVRANIFVASHHGRESGYAKETFEICKPDVIVISDEAKQYETQETAYANHARGIRWNQTQSRKVLTTRKDGMITINAEIGKGCFISAARG